jgi:hypothetical protein
MFDLNYMPKTHKADRKWQVLSGDIKMVLNIAFRDALHRPHFVAEYTETTFKLSETILTFYYFRIGFAKFKLALVQGFPEYILADLDFQDGDEAFEVLRPATI